MQKNSYVSSGNSFNLLRISMGDEAKIADDGQVFGTGEPLNTRRGSLDLGPGNNGSSHFLAAEPLAASELFMEFHEGQLLLHCRTALVLGNRTAALRLRYETHPQACAPWNRVSPLIDRISLFQIFSVVVTCCSFLPSVS